MTTLRSYVSGQWQAPAEDGRPLHDAATGAEVARVSSAGIDMAAALEHGRLVGGPALRALTFHQRAALLKSLAAYLREHRDELYELSTRTGATLGDSKFDVDGGIGVLAAYASKGTRELPNSTVYADGNVEPLGRGGTFVGQHIAVPLRGVASQTAYLTARLVELIVASGLLPAGSVQLICGSAGDLLDHVSSQDLVSFTGSAATARKLRAHPAIVRNSVRFNAEADSLNMSILGPDAPPGPAEFDLSVRQLVTEMTVKAGQKCTAIRRAFVPAELMDDVIQAANARLAGVIIGHPANPDVRMGPLASLEQREEVRRSLKALLSAGRIAYGDPERVEVTGATAERGAFVSPVLLRADDADRAEPHEVEAFGPVCTVLPYTSAAQVIELAARG